MSWQRNHSDRYGGDGGGGNRGHRDNREYGDNRSYGDHRGYGPPRTRPEAAGRQQQDDYAEEVSIFGAYAGDREADDGGWHTPPRNFAYPLRPAPQPQRPTGPAPGGSIRGDGRGGGGAHRGTPHAPYIPSSSDRIGLPRNPRPRYDYDPSAKGPPEHETYTQPRAGQPHLRPLPPQYSSADRGDPAFRPSMQSDRSIYIGFDPSTESQDNTSSSAAQNAPIQGYNQQRRPVANTPPLLSSRRAAPSSYYPQPTMQVSPIPEESSLSRHESYASSTAIPTNWGPDEFYSSSSSHSDNRRPIEGQGEHGLVRQASVGRKTRPLLTEIKGVDRSKSRRGSASAESDLSPSTSPVRSQIASPVLQVPQTTTSPGSNPRLSPTLGPPRSPRSPIPTISSPLSQPPVATDDDHYFSEKPPIPRNQSDKKQPSVTAKELGILAGEDVVLGSTQRTSTMGGTQSASIMGGQRVSTSSRIPGRRLPPRLNMDAVRDAEARGSLTSLPDLIRRATKLAAVLETGRPGSSMNWGRRNSMLGPNGRGLRGDTNSISDMLAAFPPPASRDATSRTMSRWFLPDDYDHGGDNGDVKQLRNRRRICGLPLWAFIIMVILGLVLITAAVVVPLQLVSMSKASNNDSYVTRCKKSNPCQNGGENIATSDFCGCVCTNGFTGSSCTIEEADTSCTSFNFKDRQSSSGVIAGIKNATIGSALPRLFDKGNNTYHIELDLSLLLGVFSKGNLSCTLQNALVNFTGRTQPDVQSQSRFRREVIIDRRRQLDTDPSGSSIIIDPAASPTPTGSGASATPTGSQKKNLNQDAIDFARVAVLYLAQTESLRTAEEAHQNLDTAFRGGTDSGNVTSSGVTFELDKKSIVLRNGSIVGGET